MITECAVLTQSKVKVQHFKPHFSQNTVLRIISYISLHFYHQSKSPCSAVKWPCEWYFIKYTFLQFSAIQELDYFKDKSEIIIVWHKFVFVYILAYDAFIVKDYFTPSSLE